MKNNFVLKFLFFLIIFLNFLNAYSEELRFEATSIEIIDKDKIIIAKNGVKILSGDEIVIDADQMKYNKESKFLEASGNIIIIIGTHIEIPIGICSFFPSSSKKKLK